VKYASFLRRDGSASFGGIEGDFVQDLGGGAADLKTAIARGTLDRLKSGAEYALSEVTLLPVISNPGKIFCVGHNYEAHRQETGRAQVDYPSIFTRWSDTLVAHGQPILRPKVSHSLDYEAELAVVISKGGRYITEADALDHVAGYACFNDASVRDWQRHTAQFTPGKNFPRTGAFGPWLVTPDEAGDITSLSVVCRLNGAVMQNQPVSDMIFPIPRIIAYLSQFTVLESGDVIATGTPGGVGSRRTPPIWMKRGDTVEVQIGPIGTLVNGVVDEEEEFPAVTP
jgi:2-keto-4-pentenoate hydratase/2-oxohepta-3-ene-1,7-dioic acid hydratase in catechol pathway